MNQQFSRIVINQILLLELTEDEDLCPDVASKQLESIFHKLRSMPRKDQNAFCSDVKAEVIRRKAAKATKKELSIVRGILRDIAEE